MDDETAIGSAGTPDRRGHSSGGGGIRSPLQSRAAFIHNWNWQSVISINRGACERSRAQHGFNSETQSTCSQNWETQRNKVVTLQETLEFLRAQHQSAPFLFFNGNTFATIARELSLTLFSDLPPTRKRDIASAIAHFVAGVLDAESMTSIVESLVELFDWEVGDRVKSLRGSVRGTIVRILDDGRIVWRSRGSSSELTSLPESLCRD